MIIRVLQSSVHSSRYEAHRKFGEHKRCIRETVMIEVLQDTSLLSQSLVATCGVKDHGSSDKSYVSGDKKAPNYIASEITDITFKPPEIPKDERK
ncbi:hypothetical protein pdam_00002682, partial [Pocillopora damicornis]